MNKINFTNLPSTTTPVNATNLNLLQDNVDNGKIDKAMSEYTGDLDDLQTTGLYTTTNNTTNKPTSDNYYIEVIRQSTGYYLQRATQRANSPRVYIRECMNGTWTNWLLLSPDKITTGTEYETGEFIDGKQVYRKRISLGAFPNNTNKTVVHYISNPEFVRMVIMGNNGNGTYQDMALRGPFECYATGTAIVFNPGGNYSSWTGYADLWYTKG